MPTLLTTRGQTWTTMVDFVMETCCNCAMPFLMPRVVYNELREHSSASNRPTKTFYCPAGHEQHYTGKNEEQRLRQELADEKARRERIERDREDQRQRRLHAERQASAYKGVATKAKRKAAHALCPVQGCGRTFVQMQRHLDAKHPDWVKTHAPQEIA